MYLKQSLVGIGELTQWLRVLDALNGMSLSKPSPQSSGNSVEEKEEKVRARGNGENQEIKTL